MPAPDTDWYVDTTMRSMPGRAVERRERGERDHRGAVRARDDAARQEAHVVGVDLGDHERHVVVHAERGRVVDDARAAVGGPRRPFERERVVDVDHDEVEAVEAVVAQHLADHLAARRTPACGLPNAATRTRAARRPGTSAPRAAAASRCRRGRWPRPRRPGRRTRCAAHARLQLEGPVQRLDRALDVAAHGPHTRCGWSTWRSSRC